MTYRQRALLIHFKKYNIEVKHLTKEKLQISSSCNEMCSKIIQIKQKHPNNLLLHADKKFNHN